MFLQVWPTIIVVTFIFLVFYGRSDIVLLWLCQLLCGYRLPVLSLCMHLVKPFCWFRCYSCSSVVFFNLFSVATTSTTIAMLASRTFCQPWICNFGNFPISLSTTVLPCLQFFNCRRLSCYRLIVACLHMHQCHRPLFCSFYHLFP